MQQVGLVTGGVVTKPLINVGYADFMEHGQPVTRRFSFVRHHGGNQILVHGWLIPPANFKPRGFHIPLDSVPEKVRHQKQPLFRTDREIDSDFRTVEITGQWIGNIPSHDADSVDALQMLLDPCGIFDERNFYRIHGMQCFCAESVLR